LLEEDVVFLLEAEALFVQDVVDEDAGLFDTETYADASRATMVVCRQLLVVVVLVIISMFVFERARDNLLDGERGDSTFSSSNRARRNALCDCDDACRHRLHNARKHLC
jgi:hypothetical protein